MVDQHEVIDWNQAMEQVDNDEEFLFELLDDFAEELDSKMMILHGCMNDPYKTGVQQQICSATHTIKGTASNIYCVQLREAAAGMESTVKETVVAQPVLEQNFAELGKAYEEFKKYLAERN